MLKELISLSHLSGNRDTVRNREMYSFFTSGDKQAQFLDHYRLCESSEHFSKADTRLLKSLLMKRVPSWKLNSLNMQLFIFSFSF